MRLGHYDVISQVGRGGTGSVLLARAPDGRSVAVKLLHRSDPETLARFERERRLLQSLGESEGFVPLLDAGASPQGPFLVMPFLDRGTLRDRLKRGPLPVDDTILVVKQLARALGRAHDMGLVHRDVKPENVLFGRDGRPLLADLGLAKHFEGSGRDDGAAGTSASLSVTGDLRGTVGYLAPEQARDAKSAGPPADVFALGAILYECLAGVPAYEGPSLVELYRLLEVGTVPPLRKVCPDAPRWLARVVAKAMARDPAARYPHGNALANALELGPRGTSVRPVALALSGVAALALIGTVAATLLRRPAPPAPDPATPRDDVEGARRLVEDARARFETGDLARAERLLARALAAAPQSAPAYVLRGDLRLRKGELTRVEPGRSVPLEGRFVHAWKASPAPWSTASIEEAIGDYSRAIQLAPSLAEAWLRRGTARGCAGDGKAALQDLSRAIQLAPDLAPAWINRAIVKGRSHDLAGGREDADRAVALAPASAFAWAVRATAHYATNDAAGGAKDRDHALELDPDLAVALAERAEARFIAQDVTAAYADATRAVELAPLFADARYIRAGLLSERHDPDGALAEAERAVELDPTLARAWKLLVALHQGRDDFDSAFAAVGRAIAQLPGDAGLRIFRANLHAIVRHEKEALADLGRALELDPQNAEAYGTRAMIRQVTDPRAAHDDASRAIDLDPRRAGSWSTRGSIRLRLEDWDGAAADFDRAAELEPRGAPFRLRGRATAFERKGDRAAAIRELERALAAADELERRGVLSPDMARERTLIRDHLGALQR